MRELSILQAGSKIESLHNPSLLVVDSLHSVLYTYQKKYDIAYILFCYSTTSTKRILKVKGLRFGPTIAAPQSRTVPKTQNKIDGLISIKNISSNHIIVSTI